MALGTYVASAPNITSNVSVTCTNTTPYTVSFVEGPFLRLIAATRKMAGHRRALPGYALVPGPPATANWAHTVGAGNMLGKISNPQYLEAGAFPDSVTVTVTY
jgi:spore coat protein U-like protein